MRSSCMSLLSFQGPPSETAPAEQEEEDFFIPVASGKTESLLFVGRGNSEEQTCTLCNGPYRWSSDDDDLLLIIVSERWFPTRPSRETQEASLVSD